MKLTRQWRNTNNRKEERGREDRRQGIKDKQSRGRRGREKEKGTLPVVVRSRNVQTK